MSTQKRRREEDSARLKRQLREWHFVRSSEEWRQMLDEVAELCGDVLFEAHPALLGSRDSTGAKVESAEEVRRQASLGGRARADKKRRQNEEIISKIVEELRKARNIHGRMRHSAIAHWLQRRKVVTYPNNRPISHSRLRQYFVPEALKRI